MKSIAGSHAKVVTLASLIARAAALGVVATASVSFPSGTFNVIVYALATSSAIQVLLDPATSSFVVVRWPELSSTARQALWKGGFTLQLVVAAVSVPLTAAVVGAATTSTTGVEIGAAFGMLAAAEGIARYVRTHWQARQQFWAYAAIDGVIATGRALVAVAVLLVASVDVLVVAALVVTTALVVGSTALVVRDRRTRAEPLPSVVRGVWPYGISTVFSSLYSQAPPILIGFIGNLREAAVYAVASRITQPTELVPNALVAVYLPRLREAVGSARRVVFRNQARAAVVLGATFTLAIVAASPWLLPVLGVNVREGETTLVILALALPVKFLNYQLVALALADGSVRRRLVASATVAVVSVVTVCSVASIGSAAVAAVTLGCELLLTGLLLAIARSRSLVGEAAWS